ncbi:hypothetical protein PNOK_0268400 [Pyrrhoderma noxium]|uniref:Uncharacterized protein n=1 Tax=Pyrrhoderma noxium TaxID=2282107 RepID=A0A286UT23_9AGAM|nr:hypothetical protein PNOK_0268400 [Pyrrhoderma noxium]
MAENRSKKTTTTQVLLPSSRRFDSAPTSDFAQTWEFPIKKIWRGYCKVPGLYSRRGSKMAALLLSWLFYLSYPPYPFFFPSMIITIGETRRFNPR